MLRLLIALAPFAAVLPAPAAAAPDERRVTLGSFEALRVTGTFDVTVTTGGSPGAQVIGDRGVIGDIDLSVQGTTLTVRRTGTGHWNEQPRAAATVPVRIVLTTPRLSGVTVIGGSRVAVSRLTGARIDLAASGTGTIAAATVDGDRVSVQLIGEGRIALAGRTPAARLVANGAGTIDAGALDAGDLTVHLDGPGTIAARARYTAQVASTGLGTVTVAGRPKCRVIAAAGAPVTCGTAD